MQTTRLFDLNIEKILEAWDSAHAVRELIANALDEQTLSDTRDIDIEKREGAWTIRDFGRGLRYEHFTQNENPEKLNAVGRVIGKFGVGLKDALATLDRNGIRVKIQSKHAVITLAQRAKHDFGDVVTLHAAIEPPRDDGFPGTEIRITGLRDADMKRAKGFFLRFSNETIMEETRVGRILKKNGGAARIYVAGLLVAEEDNFAFSYDITSLTDAMKKALNRERTNVGRIAYSDRIKAMLLQAKSQEVARTLADQLRQLELGTASDEVAWKDVAVHACRILNASGSHVFVTASQLETSASIVAHARSDGHNVIVIPDTIYAELGRASDINGAPIRDLGVYEEQWNHSFKFEWIPIEKLTAKERVVLDQMNRLVALVGGLPRHVNDIRISRTMRMDFNTGDDALGLWDPETSSIVIRRDQLGSLTTFAATLLHEVAHARSGSSDISSEFEDQLTDFLGQAAAAAVSARADNP